MCCETSMGGSWTSQRPGPSSRHAIRCLRRSVPAVARSVGTGRAGEMRGREAPRRRARRQVTLAPRPGLDIHWGLNGAISTSRFTGGHNAFEHLLAWLGIRQRNRAPGHPQDPGQDRALPPDPEASALAAARATDHRRAPGPARCLRGGLRRGAAASDHRAPDAGRGLPRDAQGAARRSPRPGPPPPARRHRRQDRRHDPAPGRPPAPCGDRGRQRGRRVLAIVDEREITLSLIHI